MSRRHRGRWSAPAPLPESETIVIAAYENVPGAPHPMEALHG
ncbi:hypothetical protein [Streptomyces sp. NPDC101150]